MSRILGRGAKLDPNEEIVTLLENGTHRQTLQITWERANQLAGALHEHNIRTGDRVASFMWNNYRHLELYQAVTSMGSVLHTLNIRLSPVDLEYIINHAQDRIIFVDEDLLPLLIPFLDKIPSVELLVICRQEDNSETSFENTRFENTRFKIILKSTPWITKTLSLANRQNTAGRRSMKTHPWDSAIPVELQVNQKE